MDGGRRSSLVSNRRTSPLPALRILFCVDSIVPAAPTGRNSGPRLGPARSSRRALDPTEWSLAPSANHVKRGRFTFDTKRQPVSLRCPEHAKLRTWSGKWHFNTNSFPAQPHPPKDFEAEEHIGGLSFPPLLSPDVKRGCSGEQPKKPILTRSSSPAKKPWPAGA